MAEVLPRALKGFIRAGETPLARTGMGDFFSCGQEILAERARSIDSL